MSEKAIPGGLVEAIDASLQNASTTCLELIDIARQYEAIWQADRARWQQREKWLLEIVDDFDKSAETHEAMGRSFNSGAGRAYTYAAEYIRAILRGNWPLQKLEEASAGGGSDEDSGL